MMEEKESVSTLRCVSDLLPVIQSWCDNDLQSSTNTLWI